MTLCTRINTLCDRRPYARLYVVAAYPVYGLARLYSATV